MNLADHFNLLYGGGPVTRIVNGIHYITFTPQQIHMHGTSTWLLIPRAMVLWWKVPARFMDVALSGEQAVNVVAGRCRSECGDGSANLAGWGTHRRCRDVCHRGSDPDVAGALAFALRAGLATGLAAQESPVALEPWLVLPSPESWASLVAAWLWPLPNLLWKHSFGLRFGRVRKSLPGRPVLHGTCLRAAQVRKRDRNDETVAAKCAANIMRNNGDNINRMVR